MTKTIRTFTETSDQNSVFAEWRGAKAEVWIFDLTFRRLAVLLRLPERSEALYIVGAGSRHIIGPFSWQPAKLSISPLDPIESDRIGERLTRVYDQEAQFELVCSGGVILVQCSEIVTSFDTFPFDSP